MSEFKVAQDLIENNCRVCYTPGQYPYDLIGDHDGELFKIQVKTAKKKPNQTQAYQIRTKGYDGDDVDLFAGYISEKDTEFYFPYEEAGSYCSVTFTPRYSLSDHNAELAHLADDHTFESVVDRLL
ncbi:group I intron-associated PD-(D/E)XK endonuclease [Halorussus limi]|uniref:group I intron-associated PD-(D/E)XK endonuclease n=1 Tax=Halorussus limi TaxID=2938695 RepID=UPI0034A41694